MVWFDNLIHLGFGSLISSYHPFNNVLCLSQVIAWTNIIYFQNKYVWPNLPVFLRSDIIVLWRYMIIFCSGPEQVAPIIHFYFCRFSHFKTRLWNCENIISAFLNQYGSSSILFGWLVYILTNEFGKIAVYFNILAKMYILTLWW